MLRALKYVVPAVVLGMFGTWAYLAKAADAPPAPTATTIIVTVTATDKDGTALRPRARAVHFAKAPVVRPQPGNHREGHLAETGPRLKVTGDAKTDKEGKATFTNVAPGDYIVSAVLKAKGNGKAEAKGLKAGDSTDVSITLELPKPQARH